MSLMRATRTQLRTASASACRAAVPRPLSLRTTIRTRAADNEGPSTSTSTPEPVPAPVAAGATSGSHSSVQQFQLLNPITEAINGRAAMLGFVAALITELTTNQGVWSQIAGRYSDLELVEPARGGAVLGFGMVVALTTLASLAPKLLSNAEVDSKSFGPFTPSVELLNGRIAQIGFLALILVETVKGSALF